ncbi:uncharacterized protein [Solanum lycopersicum]|uniref:uncharacterized protein n=1 Tax=Solanum lycopersicum TaxID=4081 RepID=UPI00374A7BDD
MNNSQNPANLGDGINLQPLPLVDAHNQVVVENLADEALRMQPPIPRPQYFYRGNINITDSDGPLVLPPLPQAHIFVITSSLMQMFTIRGLFSGLPSEDPHTHIAKLRSVCKSCVGRPHLDMNIIGLRVFPLSVTEEDAIWFTELSYNSTYTWDQFKNMFLARCPNHHIDDESLKEYFYPGQDYNNKAVLDTIAVGSYGECTYAEIAEKLEKISRINKSWSTKKLDSGRNTFAVQDKQSPATDEIQKVNTVNYLTKPPPPADEYYYEEDTYAVPKAPLNRIGAMVKEIKGNYGNKNEQSGPYVLPQNQEIAPRDGGEDQMTKDEEVLETSGELVDKAVKEVEVSQKVTPIPRLPPPFRQRLMKKTEDGKYRCFITMFKQLSINVPLIKALEEMPGYAKFMKDMVTKKTSVSFEDDDRMEHCSIIATRSLVQKKEDPRSFTNP